MSRRWSHLPEPLRFMLWIALAFWLFVGSIGLLIALSGGGGSSLAVDASNTCGSGQVAWVDYDHNRFKCR